MENTKPVSGDTESHERLASDDGPNRPDVTIITISTNEGDVLDRCIASVLKNMASFEFIVFNNASSDQTHQLLAEKYKDKRLIRIMNPIKKGFIENNNEGIKAARGRYVLLLNPDTVLQPDTLGKMIEFMDGHSQAAVSTCRLTYADGTIQSHVRRFPNPWTYFCRMTKLQRFFPELKSVNRYLMIDLDHQATQKVDWFITAFFFMRKSVIDEIGALDTRLFQPFYCEDVEWCFRSRLNGYDNYYVSTTSIVHDYQQSSTKKFGKLTLIHLCNIFIFFRKHFHAMISGKVRPI